MGLVFSKIKLVVNLIDDFIVLNGVGYKALAAVLIFFRQNQVENYADYYSKPYAGERELRAADYRAAHRQHQHYGRKA